jgi:hypothetical protein
LADKDQFIDVDPHYIQTHSDLNSFKSVTVIGGVTKPGIFFYKNDELSIPRLLVFAGEFEGGRLDNNRSADRVDVMFQNKVVKMFSIKKFIVGVTHKLRDGEVLYRQLQIKL